MTASQATLRGSCLCGAVSFELVPPTKFVAHCHCSLCRRAHGAAWVTWVGVPDAQFRLLDGERELGRYASSEAATRRFCRTCGTPLFFTSSRWPGETHVAAATLLDALDFPPQAHVFFDDRVDWGRDQR